VRVKCVHCGYEWGTESELLRVTCPSCGKKTPNPEKKPEYTRGRDEEILEKLERLRRIVQRRMGD